MPILPGKRLGPYEVLSAIGRGGMGEVYHAKDTRLDRIVAIKIQAKEQAQESSLTEMFLVQNWFEDLKQKVPTGKR
jgi:serine/threonine protein kinase